MLNRLHPLLIIVLLAVILPVVWFKDGYILGTAESGIPFYDLGRYYEVTANSWTDTGLGNSTGSITASKLTHFALSGLQNAQLPNFIIEGIFFCFILSTSGIGIYFLIKALVPKINSWFAILGVVFYWFNPISLVNIWNRFLTNHFVFFAFLPIGLAIYLKGLVTKEWKWSIYLGLASLIYSYVFISPAFIILIWSIFLYTTLFYMLISKNGFKDWYYSFVYFITSLAVFVIFNLWWVWQLISYFFSNSYVTSATSFFSSQGNLSILSYLSDRLGQFSYVFRFLHSDFFLQDIMWRQIYLFWPIVLLEFCVFGMILFAIYQGRKKKEILYVSFMFVATIFLLKGNSYPFGELYEYLFIRFPVLQVFRNPFEKIGIVLGLSGSILFVFGLDVVWKSELPRIIKKVLVAVMMGFIVGVWGFPYWSGWVFTSQYPPANELSVGYKVKVPDYYSEVNQWFKKQPGEYRILVLPIGGEGITQTWEKGYTGIDVTYALFSKPAVSFNTTIPNYYDIVEQVKKYQLSQDLLQYAKFINVRYIVWRGDIDFRDRNMADPKDVRDRLEAWVKEGFLEKQYEKGKLIVYKISDIDTAPRIFSTSNIIFSDDTDLVGLSKRLNISQQNNYAFLKFQDRSVLADHPEILIPKVVFSPSQIDSEKLLSDDDLIARLPHVSHIPNTQVYDLVRLKEQLQIPSKTDLWQWVYYQSELLGKRAVEIYLLKKSTANDDLVAKLEEEYVTNLNELAGTIQSVFSTQDSVGSMISDSLIHQWILLGRVNSKVSNDLEICLIELRIKPKYDLPEINGIRTLVYRYDVIENGDYTIFLDGISTGDKLYIDGKLLSVIPASSKVNAVLSKGTHEVAFVEDLAADKLLFTENQLELEESSQWVREIKFDEFPSEYLLRFDYLFKKGDVFKLNLIQNTDNFSDKRLTILKDDFDHTKRSFGITFQSGSGAVSANLFLDKIYKKKCDLRYIIISTCRDELNKFDVLLTDLKLVKLRRPLITLKKGELQPSPNNDTGVNFKKLSSTKYEVNINKISNTPEIIVFSELFNTGWKLIDEDADKVSESPHLLVNDYANGWLLDRAGNYHFLIKFVSEDELIISQWVSGISVIIGIMALVLLKKK